MRFHLCKVQVYQPIACDVFGMNIMYIIYILYICNFSRVTFSTHESDVRCISKMSKQIQEDNICVHQMKIMINFGIELYYKIIL